MQKNLMTAAKECSAVIEVMHSTWDDSAGHSLETVTRLWPDGCIIENKEQVTLNKGSIRVNYVNDSASLLEITLVYVWINDFGNIETYVAGTIFS